MPQQPRDIRCRPSAYKLLDHQLYAAWYLYLRPDGDSVIARCDHDISHDPGVLFGPDGKPAAAQTEASWCAPNVESFAYRCWVERTPWFAIFDRLQARDLSSEQRATWPTTSEPLGRGMAQGIQPSKNCQVISSSASELSAQRSGAPSQK